MPCGKSFPIPQRHLLRAFLLALALAASGLHARDEPASSITLDSGVTFAALPVQIAPGGQLSFTAPFIQGQARSSLAGIVHMKFPRSREEKRGAHTLRLVNGDRIVGDLVALDEDVFVFDSQMLGELEIPRDIVHTVARRGKTRVLIDNTFAIDGFDQWKIGRGEWIATDKGLCLKTGSFNNWVQYRIPYDGPITLVATIDARMHFEGPKDKSNYFRTGFTFFAPPVSEDSWKLGSVAATFGSAGCSARLRAKGRPSALASGDAWPEGKGEVRIAYDPATFTIKLWIGEKCIVDNTLDVGPESGGFVRFSSSTAVTLQSVRMYRGIVPPGSGGVTPAEDTEGILFLNGDRLDAGELEIEDERVVAHSPNGNQYKLDLDKIGYIVMRKKGRRSLPRRKDDTRVRLHETSVQLKLDKLTDEALTGNHAGLGDLSIPRAALVAIDCDLHGKKRAAADKTKGKDGSVMTLANGTILPATFASADSNLAIVTAPWLTGAAKIKLQELVRLDLLRVGRPEPGNEKLFLTDGSQIAGTLQEISADAFELRTKSLGAFKPARKFVRSVCTNRETGVIDATDFTCGAMGKWRPIGGEWEFLRDGLLSVHGSGSRGLVLALADDGPITVEVAVHHASNNASPFPQLGFCTTKPAVYKHLSDGLFFEGLLFNFGPTGVRASTPTQKKKRPPPITMKHPATRPFFTPGRGATTIAWDPATSMATAWGDGRFLATTALEAGPKGVKYIVLGTDYNAVVFDSVRVWKGIVAPPAADELAIADKDVALDKKGKAAGAGKITMADGKVRIPTDTGDLTCPLAELGSILTARNARMVIARKPEHVRVGLARSVILLRLKSMDAEFLEGVSPTLGSVCIPRDAVRWIEIKTPGQR